jgi:hypothetical protein
MFYLLLGLCVLIIKIFLFWMACLGQHLHCLLPVTIIVWTFSTVGAAAGGTSQASFMPSLFCPLVASASVHLMVI